MENVILIIILVAVVGCSALYVYRAKKKGVKCIGCPSGCKCTGKSCSGNCTKDHESHK